ncbi:hypothetical protein ZOSMA_301G00030 [Zostera marina]|uniref:Uncharacterized protein n=1 Tax=Zostera marina TaxID=29655 RepID=A0A0K9PCP8_ZOSMR|nr:hypothetical protein ZOSMA_301G00030 [Zostera marina]
MGKFLHFQFMIEPDLRPHASAFIFLYENQLLLTFQNRTISMWNFRGEIVTSFEDHLLWHPYCNTNNIYITSDQDLIISYCKVNCVHSIAEAISLLVFRCFLIFFGCYMVICIWMLFFKFVLMD